MRRILVFVGFLVSALLFLLLASRSWADCGTSPVEIQGKSWVKEWWGGKGVVTFIYLCSADAEDTLDDLTVNSSGALLHIGVVPVTSKEPTSVTPVIRPLPIGALTSPPAYTPTAFTTPFARQDVEPPQGLANGWVVDTEGTFDATDQWYYTFTFLVGD